MSRARDFADVISGQFDIPAGSLGDGSITTLKLAEDLYKEGTATLNLRDSSSPTGGNASSTTPSLKYTKIGRVVFFNFSMNNIDTTGLASTAVVYIHGLPFTPASGQGTQIAYSLIDSVDFASTRHVLTAIASTSDYMIMRGQGDNIGDDNIDWQYLSDNVTDITLQGHYYTND